MGEAQPTKYGLFYLSGEKERISDDFKDYNTYTAQVYVCLS